jgi:hypothetical protein
MMTSWENLNSRPFVAYGPGGGAEKAVVEQAFQAELAQTREQKSAMLLWDMADYFENMSREALVERTGPARFYPGIVRAALMMYSMNRIVTFAGLLEIVGFSTRGLCAGCGFVTTFIQVYTLQALDRAMSLLGQIPATISLRLYVDDIACQVSADTNTQAAEAMVLAANVLEEMVRLELFATIAPHKAQVWAAMTS